MRIRAKLPWLVQIFRYCGSCNGRGDTWFFLVVVPLCCPLQRGLPFLPCSLTCRTANAVVFVIIGDVSVSAKGFALRGRYNVIKWKVLLDKRLQLCQIELLYGSVTCISFFNIAQEVISTLSNLLRARGAPEDCLLCIENNHINTEACCRFLNLALFLPQTTPFKVGLHSYAFYGAIIKSTVHIKLNQIKLYL